MKGCGIKIWRRWYEEWVHLEILGNDIVVTRYMVPALAAAVQPWPNQVLHCRIRSMQKSLEKAINYKLWYPTTPNFSSKRLKNKNEFAEAIFWLWKDEDWDQWLRSYSLMKIRGDWVKIPNKAQDTDKQTIGVEKDRIRLNIESH